MYPANVIFIPDEVTPLQFLIEHQDEYRQLWRNCMSRMGTLRQKMRNPRLDLYHRMEAATAILELESQLQTLGELTSPPSLPQEPPAIIYRFPTEPMDPKYVCWARATKGWNPRPPFEPLSGWNHILADDHPWRKEAS